MTESLPEDLDIVEFVEIDTDPYGTSAPLCCLSLVTIPSLQDWWMDLFAAAKIPLLHRVPASVSEAQTIVEQANPAVVLAYLPGGAVAGDALSDRIPLKSVRFPPLIVMMDRAPSEAEREALRLQGATYVVTLPLVLDRDAPLVAAVARSASWLSADSSANNTLPDLLQTLAASRKSVMISVGCPHCRSVSARSWRESHGRSFCGLELSPEGQCDGWYGRIYLQDGSLIHAETPTANAVPALAEMIQLPFSSVRAHEVFLAPLSPNIDEQPLHRVILQAACLLDEWRHANPPQPLDQPLDPPEPVKGSVTMQSASVLLSQVSGVRAAARADARGHVQEVFGQLDGETTCAIATMCVPHLEAAAGLLQLGNLRDFAVVSEKMALYALRCGADTVVATGDASKNPDSQLKKMSQLMGDRR